MTQDDHKPDYVIRKRRSSNWYWALALIILAALLAAAAFGYFLNQKRYDFSETAEQQFLQVQDSLKEANASAVRWQQQYEVEKAISDELRKHTFDLELKLYNRNKEVEAYQRIFDPDSVESGLQIASFSWEPLNPELYQYRLILIQAKQQSANISGKYELSLVGTLEGEEREISFDELESLTEKDRKFKFKYMEVRSGSFSLPANFQARFIRVVVTSSGRNGKSIMQDFDWQPVAASKTTNNQQLPSETTDPTGGH
ncbi:MAG: hypothetical protein HWE16_11785 [Gammaproteobacteria bacterium]|nr:hypothetical protein [Gammaproteobacteria bacterium]